MTSREDARPPMSQIFNAKSITMIGTWNVLTLFQSGKMDQVLGEMRAYHLDILGVSEMRSSGQGCLYSDDMTVLYSDHNEQHTDGVGIILSKLASRALVCWQPVNERIVTARLNTKLAKVTVVQVYAPTEIAPDEEKDIFYDHLQDVLQEVPSFVIKVVLGDFNAKLDTERRGMHAIIGPMAQQIAPTTTAKFRRNSMNTTANAVL